jgi:hypothetical protein
MNRMLWMPRHLQEDTPSSSSSLPWCNQKPESMIARVYATPHPSATSESPSYHNSSPQGGARSYTIFVPRTIEDFPYEYTLLDFVPEMRNYILNNNFCADMVSKMRLPSFIAEDTALNWFESVTIYCGGVGIYVLPYVTMEQGRPLGPGRWCLRISRTPVT